MTWTILTTFQDDGVLLTLPPITSRPYVSSRVPPRIFLGFDTTTAEEAREKLLDLPEGGLLPAIRILVNQYNGPIDFRLVDAVTKEEIQ